MATHIRHAVAALLMSVVPAAAQTLPPAPAAEAARMFADVCVAHRGDLSDAYPAIAALPTTHDTEADIHYHTDYDLSFKLTPVGDGRTQCSMVWSSTDDVDANAAAILEVAPDADPPILFSDTLMRTRLIGKD